VPAVRCRMPAPSGLHSSRPASVDATAPILTGIPLVLVLFPLPVPLSILSLLLLLCSVLFFSHPRSEGRPHRERTFSTYRSLSSAIPTDSSMVSPVHVLMLSIQVCRGQQSEVTALTELQISCKCQC